MAFHGPTKTLTPGRSRALVALSALGVVTLAVSAAHSTLGLGAPGLPWQLIFVAVYAAAGSLCLARAAWVQTERATWLCLGVGILLHGSGWLVDYVGYHGLAPMPSWSDPLWLAAYLGFYPGIVLLGPRALRAPEAWGCGSTDCSAASPWARSPPPRRCRPRSRTSTPPAAPRSRAPPTRWRTSRC